MNINIESINFKADSKLKDFITERIEKLSNLHDGVLNSDVILKIDKNDKNENKTTEIKMIIKGEEFFAKKQSKTFEGSTDNTIEALRRQLKKYKGKMENKHRK
ncbi:MAG: ribosome-associated translation inhibitor RaiA [Bacteroidales bacterium]|nr:ribosome-associated translation inhibitor RaiA [Bacteroidales bacterium]